MKAMKQRGLGVVRMRPGSSYWWIEYNVSGKRHRESSKSHNRADAVHLLKQRLAAVQAGQPVGTQLEKTTLGEITEMVLTDYKANQRRGLGRAEQAVKRLLEFSDFRDAAPIVLQPIASRRM